MAKTALIGMHNLASLGKSQDAIELYQDMADGFDYVIEGAGYNVTRIYGLPSTLEAIRQHPYELYVVEINLDQPKIVT